VSLPGLQRPRRARSIVVIGSSTGGTRVLTHLMACLPALSACVVVVQHMPRFINPSFCRTLAGVSRNPVRLAQDGDLLEPGLILVAPSEVHCTIVQNRQVRLVAGPAVNWVCPAIDVTMQSLTPPAPGGELVGVLLTGMGKDGAVGLGYIRSLGGTTIAQTEATCAVYGMPGEAVRLGNADYEMSPDGVARFLAGRFRTGE